MRRGGGDGFGPDPDWIGGGKGVGREERWGSAGCGGAWGADGIGGCPDLDRGRTREEWVAARVGLGWGDKEREWWPVGPVGWPNRVVACWAGAQ